MMALRFDQRFYDSAQQLVADRNSAAGKSAAWTKGLIESIAWHMAGLPITPGRDRYTECPYPSGTAEFESYQSGWHEGKRECLVTGIHTPSGPLWELNRPGGVGWIHVLAEHHDKEQYVYEITDEDGEIVQRSSDAFDTLEQALYAALKEEWGSY